MVGVFERIARVSPRFQKESREAPRLRLGPRSRYEVYYHHSNRWTPEMLRRGRVPGRSRARTVSRPRDAPIPRHGLAIVVENERERERESIWFGATRESSNALAGRTVAVRTLLLKRQLPFLKTRETLGRELSRRRFFRLVEAERTATASTESSTESSTKINATVWENTCLSRATAPRPSRDSRERGRDSRERQRCLKIHRKFTAPLSRAELRR